MAQSRYRKISTLGSRLTSLASVALVLLVAGLAALALMAGRRLQNEVRSSVGFVVLMDSDAPSAAINGVKTALMAHRGVENFTFTSAEDILESESDAMGYDVASMTDGNPYSSEFAVRVRPAYAVPDSVGVMAAFFGELPGVADIEAETAVIEGVDRAMHRATLILAGAAAVLLLVALALISNTVSLSIYSRRFIIHTMKLVGATPAYIRRPFIAAGLGGGALAGLCAALLLVGARYYAGTLWPGIDTLVSWTAAAATAAMMVAAGAAITGFTSAVAANRYLKANYDQMFLK